MTTYRRIQVKPLAGALGAQVSGADLADLDDATFAEIHAAWLAHEVLFFRDQDLSPDQHKAFGRRFGTLQVHPFLHSRAEDGHPEIVVLESDEKMPVVAAGWHSDVTFSPTPPMASILRGVDVPEFGGDTMWASCTRAYDALSSKMKQLLADLTAIHDTSKTFSRNAYPSKSHPDANEVPTAEHPVVRTHPDTGAKCLYVNGFTTHFTNFHTPENVRCGQDYAPGAAQLLQYLVSQAFIPEYQVRRRLRTNTVAIWDNRCTQHYAVQDFWPAVRKLERAGIIGDRPA